MIRYPASPLLSFSSISPRPQRSRRVLPSLRSFSVNAVARGPVLNILKHDHHELGAYYPHIVGDKSADERTRYRNLFVWELARHSVAEEIVIYPAIERHVNNGRDIASKDRDQHQSIKDQLYRLQNLKAEDPDFEPTIRSLFSNLQQHVKEEEEHDIPELEAKLDEDSLLRLRNSFERTKSLVPTRSHPRLPRTLPLEAAAALLVAPIDKSGRSTRQWTGQGTTGVVARLGNRRPDI
ncbi:HHE domain protein [Daldinia vernicosa]|uniref:HHE domain protein n=1 Tax=Daldinia vernicosa TaxID=114800 RepID=UPI00200827EA|nr:HHE domain protein [Daldinia vernicosa]KAI0846322.1 HHE domain protein [Daldinia vernicosa]